MKPDTPTKTELRSRITELEHALVNVRDGLKSAPNPNVASYIDAVLDGDYNPNLTPNDRVEGRDAALSRRVPSHDGLAGKT